MNLPHKKPLLFAREVIKKDDKTAEVLCKFDMIPTLAMFLEASAQSTIAFSKNTDIKIGFLISAQDVKQINKIEEFEYIIKIEKEIEVNNMKKFYFESFTKENNLLCTSGKITIFIQD